MGSDQTLTHLVLAMYALCLRSADAYLAFVPSSTHGVSLFLAWRFGRWLVECAFLAGVCRIGCAVGAAAS